MNGRLTYIACATVITVALILTSTAYGADCPESALTPPTERPSPNEPGVRGKVRYVPYYPGYCRHAHSLLLFHLFGHHGAGCCLDDEDWGWTGPGSTDYGVYSGAPQDEARLLHLGGNGPYNPSHASPDIIDAIEGGYPR